MRVVAVEHVATDRSIDGAVLDALAALAAADPDPNPTMSAIATAYPPRPGWTCAAFTAFSSDRGWTAAQFNGHGTWFLGAAETLVAPDDAGRVNDVIRAHSEVGARVVVLSYSPQEPPPPVSPALPNDLAAVAVVALAEQVKADVAETMSYFAAQGVAVKVLSGDSPATVAAIAARAGLGVSVPVDACDLPDDPTALAAFVDAHDVFGRVHPEQKQAVVVALQQAGHTVAMTGDGVNDLLALKRADVGIAMGQGSTATRSVAQFVLLDGSFAALPAVVAEGRRVIANVERVAGLFVAKTVYAFALALTTGVARLPFPLLPRQLSLIGALSIGLPGFVLAMEPNQTRARPGFARRVLRTAIPAGVVAAAATFAAYADARSDGATLPAARTTATVVLFIVASWLLALVARPWNTRRLALLVSLVALFATALLLPATRRYFEFTAPPSRTWPTAGALILVACAALSAGRRLASRHAAA